MFNKRIRILALAAAALMTAGEACAGTAEADAARKIGEALKNGFSPEGVSVTVAEGGRRAWAECAGAIISGIRIKGMKIDAALDAEAVKKAETSEEIMDCIDGSKGEITLSEHDVNDYFSENGGAGGFYGLVFDFTPRGYTAKGRFKAELLVLKIDLDLKAEGKLALKSDGVYLSDTVIYAEGARQPDAITELVTERVNPLLSFSEIPFPIEFSRLSMTGEAVTMSGNPEKAGGGESWNWENKE